MQTRKIHVPWTRGQSRSLPPRSPPITLKGDIWRYAKQDHKNKKPLHFVMFFSFFCWFIVLQLFMFHFLSYQAFVRGVCVPDVGVVWPCQDRTRSASIGPQSKTKRGLRIGDPWPFPWEQGASFRLSLSSATRVNSYVETSKIRTADWWNHPSTWECKSDQWGAAKWPRDVPEGFERWNGISTTRGPISQNQRKSEQGILRYIKLQSPWHIPSVCNTCHKYII